MLLSIEGKGNKRTKPEATAILSVAVAEATKGN